MEVDDYMGNRSRPNSNRRTEATSAWISEKVLTEQLRELESDGIVIRREFDEVPPKVEYELTPSGKELNDAVHAVAEWGKRHQANAQIPKCTFVRLPIPRFGYDRGLPF